MKSIGGASRIGLGRPDLPGRLDEVTAASLPAWREEFVVNSGQIRLLRLVGAVLEEQNDEWAVGRRYFSTESMHKLTEPTNEEVVKALLELESA